MAKKRIVNLEFPNGGVVRRLGYQNQAPYTTFDAKNVCPESVLDGRGQGGSRPGLGIAYRDTLGGGSPIRMMAEMNVVDTDAYYHWADNFEGDQIAAHWSAASWADGSPSVANGYAYANYGSNELGVVRSVFGISSGEYELDLWIVPYEGAHHGSSRIFFRMNNTTPAGETNGAIATLTMTGSSGAFSGALVVYVAGVPTTYAFTSGTDGFAAAGRFVVKVSTNSVSCFWRGATLLAATTISAATGARVGFSLHATVASGRVQAEQFRINYDNLVGGLSKRRRVLMAASNGQLYRETYLGHLEPVGTNIALPTDYPFQAQEHGQKLYIAVYGNALVPLVYDWATNATTNWPVTEDLLGNNLGTLPTNNTLICLWRDRIVLAGDLAAPNMWYMSRQGDPGDWDYSAEDDGAAVAGNNATAGVVGEPITALVPHGDLCLVMGCVNSLWILRGDPKMGGQLDNLSRNIGIVGPRAWCHTPENELIFLSRDGLYVMAGPCGSMPTSLSRELLPRELVNTDPATTYVQMAYDIQGRRVHIYLVRNEIGDTLHWWFDWTHKSFWPVEIYGTHEPTSMLAFQPLDFAECGVLIGGRDGVIRRFDKNNNLDDGPQTISSYVFYGPIMLGKNGYTEGVLSELIGTINTESAPVSWEVYAGDSPNAAAVLTTPQATGDWTTQGLNPKDRSRVRGEACYVKVKYKETRPWAVERITLMIVDAGGLRV